MEESSSSSIIVGNMEEEVLGAAKQLMQLSNDDDSSTNVVAATENKNRGGGEEEVDQKRCQIETATWLKIEEIFGKEEEEDREQVCDAISRPRRRRFRSIQTIYMKTKPVDNRRFYGKGDRRNLNMLRRAAI